MAIDVVLIGDKNVVWGLAVTGRSALENASETLNIWVICQKLTADMKQRLLDSWQHENLGQVTFREIPQDWIAPFRSTGYLKSKMTYARYFVADLFPECDQCICLDPDLLVLRDLAALWHMDRDGKALAAVRDVSVRVSGEGADHQQRLSLATDDGYFNAGVLVLDLEYWRKHDITAKIIDLSHRKKDILHSMDQDALNVVFDGNTVLLDPSWNASQYEKPEPLDGQIVHLIGSVKPWHLRYQKKFSERYYQDVIFGAYSDILERTAYRGSSPRNPLGLGMQIEEVRYRVPTKDMVTRKLGRLIRK